MEALIKSDSRSGNDFLLRFEKQRRQVKELRVASERAAPLLFALSYLQDERTGRGGATLKEKREVWAGSGMKTKEQWQDFRLVGRLGLTHAALVLRYNLAF